MGTDCARSIGGLSAKCSSSAMRAAVFRHTSVRFCVGPILSSGLLPHLSFTPTLVGGLTRRLNKMLSVQYCRTHADVSQCP